MIANRRLRLAVIPAAFAAFALAGCQDEAPTAAPPAAPTAQSTTQAPAGGDTQAPSSESSSSSSSAAQPAPAPSSASSTSASGGSAPAGGAVCDTTSANRPGDAPAKPIGTKQTAAGTGYGKDTDIAVTVGKPTLDTSVSDDYFPGEGMQVAIFPVTIQLAAGDYAVVSHMNVSVIDPEDNPCKFDQLNDVVPDSKSIDVTSLKGTDSVSGQLAFAVPQGADLTKYRVIFASQYNGKAELTWNAS